MKLIDAAEIKKILESGEKVVLLDVRSREEHQRSKISNSINLPYEMIEEKIKNIVPDKKTKIIVYCLSGSRSAIAAQSLDNLGYTDVVDLKNGLLSWRANEFTLE